MKTLKQVHMIYQKNINEAVNKLMELCLQINYVERSNVLYKKKNSTRRKMSPVGMVSILRKEGNKI